MDIEPKRIGILGGGQLGKMIAIAALRLGVRVVVWAQPGDNPAFAAAHTRIEAPFDDADALRTFCRHTEVVTTEWENIPITLLAELDNKLMSVCPSRDIVRISQDRWVEKNVVTSRTGVQCAPTAVLSGSPQTLCGMPEDVFYEQCFPAIIKTRCNGYDGKGQHPIKNRRALLRAIDTLGLAEPFILEKRVNFWCEGSVLVARNSHGTKVSPMILNTHSKGILRTSRWAPNMFGIDLAANDRWRKAERSARRCAKDVADALSLTGIIVLEFFVMEDGTVLFNEMAPRPHNSFHGTIEAGSVSQFEQHVRAVLNMPLAEMRLRPFTMKNLIGTKDFLDASRRFARKYHPYEFLHIYGKQESRNGRKMGHVTCLFDELSGEWS